MYKGEYLPNQTVLNKGNNETRIFKKWQEDFAIVAYNNNHDDIYGIRWDVFRTYWMPMEVSHEK